MNDMTKQTIERRAIEAAIWGMSIVSVHAMRRAFLEDAKAKYNDFVYWSKPADWKCQVTTPTDTALYGTSTSTPRMAPLSSRSPHALKERKE